MRFLAVYLSTVVSLVFLLSAYLVKAQCNGQHEFFACGSACDTTCANLGQTCPIVNIVCNNMCYCEAGYARDANGVCISIDQCPSHDCKGENEEFNKCGSACPPSCASLKNEPGFCIAMCIEGCFCAPGYVKNKEGKCVRPADC